MLTDRRLRAVLGTLRAAGPGLGDLAASPGGAAAFFRPLKAGLRSAAASGRGPSLPAVAAAEDFAARLERAFSDMHRLEAPPDEAVLQALAFLQRACAIAPRLLSHSARPAAYDLLRAHCAGGRRALRQAKAAADSPPSDFPANLKFSSIYSGLDGAFEAFERCAEALFRA